MKMQNRVRLCIMQQQQQLSDISKVRYRFRFRVPYIITLNKINLIFYFPYTPNHCASFTSLIVSILVILNFALSSRHGHGARKNL